MYDECDRCGRIDRLASVPDREPYRPGAGREERTWWTPAFEDKGQL